MLNYDTIRSETYLLPYFPVTIELYVPEFDGILCNCYLSSGTFFKKIPLGVGNKTHQKGEFLPNRIAFHCNTSHFVVSPNIKIIAF